MNFEQWLSRLPRQPDFLLRLLPEINNSNLYGCGPHLTYQLSSRVFFFSIEKVCWLIFSIPGPWKCKNISKHGIVTQCIAPTRVNDQNVTNVLLKINAKVGYTWIHIPRLSSIFSLFFFGLIFSCSTFFCNLGIKFDAGCWTFSFYSYGLATLF